MSSYDHEYCQNQIAKLEEELEAVHSRCEEMLDVLCECEEYFEQRSDADHTGVTYIANQEMRLLMAIHKILGVRRIKE